MLPISERLMKQWEETELFLNRVCDTSGSQVPQSGQDISRQPRTDSIHTPAQKCRHTTSSSNPEDSKRSIHRDLIIGLPLEKLINAAHHINSRKQKNRMLISKDTEKKNRQNSISFANLKQSHQHKSGSQQSMGSLPTSWKESTELQLTSYSMVKECVPSPKIKNRAKSLSVTQEVLTKGEKTRMRKRGERR